MSLIEAVTNIAAEAGYVADSIVIGSNDQTTRQLRALAQRLIGEMADKYPWPAFYASGSVTLTPGVPSCALPAAFSYYHYDTFWNSTKRYRLIGPISEQEYAFLQGRGFDAARYQKFQIRGISNKQLLITPTPTVADTIIFEYIAARSVRPLQWSQGLQITSGAYIFTDGRYYLATTSGTTGSTEPIHTTGSATDGGVTWSYYTGAYTKFLADTDEPLINQRILEQGMLERFAGKHDISENALFDDQLHEEFAKQKPARILSAASCSGSSVVAYGGTVTFSSGRSNWI